MQTIVEQAKDLYNLGYAVTITRQNSKAPFLPNWQKRKLSLDEIEKIKSSGIGIVAGELSNNLVVIDFDNDDCLETIKKLFSKNEELRNTPLIRTGSGKYHIWVNCPDLPSEVTNMRKVSSKKIEIRANRSFCVTPPSIHPNGNNYVWIKNVIDYKPISINFEKLVNLVKNI